MLIRHWGANDIHSKVLKEGVESISIALELIFNRSLLFGKIYTL